MIKYSLKVVSDLKKRSEQRKIAMTILYQISLRKDSHIPYTIDEVIKENMEEENEFVKDLVYGVNNNEEQLNTLANKYLKDWDIKRIDKIGSAILKIALYELKYMDTPKIVVINEAVELAKNYTEDDLAKMINAVLDRYIKE